MYIIIYIYILLVDVFVESTYILLDQELCLAGPVKAEVVGSRLVAGYFPLVSWNALLQTNDPFGCVFLGEGTPCLFCYWITKRKAEAPEKKTHPFCDQSPFGAPSEATLYEEHGSVRLRQAMLQEAKETKGIWAWRFDRS